MSTVNTYEAFAKQFEVNYNTHSEDNKSEFLNAWDLIVTATKAGDTRAKAIEALIEQGKDIKSDNARRAYNSVARDIEAYAELPSRYVNLTAIEWDNLKRVLALVKRVNKHYDDTDIADALKEMSEVYTKGMSAFRYNNVLLVTLKELRESYPVPEKEVKVEYKDVYATVEKLSTDDKDKLFNALLEELGYAKEVA